MTNALLARLPAPGAYAKGWREVLELAKINPGAMVTVPGWIVGMPGWGRQTVTVAEVVRRMRRALHARITERGEA